MNKIIEILIGLILLLIPIYVWIVNYLDFGTAALLVFKRLMVWAFIFIGLVLLILGISDLRS